MSHWEFPDSSPLGYADITVSTNAAAPTVLNPPIDEASSQPALGAFVQCQRATARLRMDGGNPTANSGFMLAAGDGLFLSGPKIEQAKFLADTNTAPTLSVTYFQY